MTNLSMSFISLYIVEIQHIVASVGPYPLCIFILEFRSKNLFNVILYILCTPTNSLFKDTACETDKCSAIVSKMVGGINANVKLFCIIYSDIDLGL